MNMSITNQGNPRSYWRALASTDMSGGNDPPLTKRAAYSLGNGGGQGAAGRPGRSNISPWSLGPSLTLYSAAIAATSAAEKSGPPSSPRLRNDSSARL